MTKIIQIHTLKEINTFQSMLPFRKEDHISIFRHLLFPQKYCIFYKDVHMEKISIQIL